MIAGPGSGKWMCMMTGVSARVPSWNIPAETGLNGGKCFAEDRTGTHERIF